MTAATDSISLPLLEFDGVTAGYGRSTVLRKVNLAVPKGAVVALLGPNGAGKTTLLKVAVGLIRPTQGSVRLGQDDVTRASPSRRTRSGLCHIPEGRGIFRSLTVRDNLRMQLPPWSKDVNLDAALEMFPVLGERLRQIAGTLSGGQQQMLALSRAYLSHPEVVLLDEVSMGLAPKVVDEIFIALKRLAATGVSLLLVEQYVNRALEMCDRVAVLSRGELAFEGRPNDLDEDALRQTYLS